MIDYIKDIVWLIHEEIVTPEVYAIYIVFKEIYIFYKKTARAVFSITILILYIPLQLLKMICL